MPLKVAVRTCSLMRYHKCQLDCLGPFMVMQAGGNMQQLPEVAVHVWLGMPTDVPKL